MAEYQITSWRDLPSLVVARDGDIQAKVPMPSRFQEAIDEAAMRLGETSSDAYLAGWQRGPWTQGEAAPADLAAQVAAKLDERWGEQSLAQYLDRLGPARA